MVKFASREVDPFATRSIFHLFIFSTFHLLYATSPPLRKRIINHFLQA